MQTLTLACYGFAAMRALIGIAPIVAAKPTSRLLGFPAEHDTPTTRLMARLFGVRDIGLGALVLMTMDNPVMLWRAFALNLCMDLGDAVMISVPLVRRQGIDRAAGASLGFALTGAMGWVVLMALSR